MGRKDAIEKMCKECSYDRCLKGGWREQAWGCQITDCPLHPYRPQPRSLNYLKNDREAQIRHENDYVFATKDGS